MEKENQGGVDNKFFMKYRITDIVTYLYLVVIFGIYLNFFDNKYFNITYTRYKCFMACSITYLATMLVAFIAEYIISKKYSIELGVTIDKRERRLTNPDIWMELFFAANLFAWIIADDKKAAFTGENGRYIGLAAVIVFFMIYVAMSSGFKMHTMLYMLLGLSTLWAHIVGISQHHGYDFLHLRDRIAEKKKYVFISNFGNINVYASFICITLPLFMCIFIFAKQLWYRLAAAVILAASGMAIMVCASDSVYLGVGFAAVLIWFLAFKDSRVVEYFAALAIVMLGNLATVIMNKQTFSKHKKREGLSKTFDNMSFAVTVLVVLIVLGILAFFIYRKYGDRLREANKKKPIIIMLLAMLVVGAAVIIYGVSSKSDLFVFNDKWGDYRGFVWRISTQIYSDFPITNKIFGYGNETVRELTVSGYHDEMVSLTNSIYDNCHNEILQFLLTTGLLGAIGYIGIFISTTAYILKNSCSDYLAYIPAAVMFGYFAQAMVCVSQPITTPLYYVFVAIGVGYVRYLKYRKKAEE